MTRVISFLVSAGVLLVVCRLAPAGETNNEATMKTGMVKVRLLDEKGRLAPVSEVSRVVKTDAEWKKLLTPEQYGIARSKGTERPFCGRFYDHKKPGLYICVCCGLPLFDAGTKFDSGTGWPSFFKPVAGENITTLEDRSAGMVRAEIECARCGAHLGHVFDDGPKPTGLRYCLNSESLTFILQKESSMP